jgi:hypothetical protein
MMFDSWWCMSFGLVVGIGLYGLHLQRVAGMLVTAQMDICSMYDLASVSIVYC